MKSRMVMASLILTIAVSVALLPSLAGAGCYSDYCANQRSGAISSRITLGNGGSYDAAARNQMNYSRGFGTGRNNHYYSPNLPAYRGGGNGYRASTITPAQQYKINQSIQRADRLINHINNDRRIWGGY